MLLVGCLTRRLKVYEFTRFTEYYRLLASGQQPVEVQTMVDLLTTNETYFFREPKHFEFLYDEIIAKRKVPGSFRIWSAASWSGEEIYQAVASSPGRALCRRCHRLVPAEDGRGGDAAG